MSFKSQREVMRKTAPIGLPHFPSGIGCLIRFPLVPLYNYGLSLHLPPAFWLSPSDMYPTI
jgi:hypothetical protein